MMSGGIAKDETRYDFSPYLFFSVPISLFLSLIQCTHAHAHTHARTHSNNLDLTLKAASMTQVAGLFGLVTTYVTDNDIAEIKVGGSLGSATRSKWKARNTRCFCLLCYCLRACRVMCFFLPLCVWTVYSINDLAAFACLPVS